MILDAGVLSSHLERREHYPRNLHKGQYLSVVEKTEVISCRCMTLDALNVPKTKTVNATM